MISLTCLEPAIASLRVAHSSNSVVDSEGTAVFLSAFVVSNELTLA